MRSLVPVLTAFAALALAAPAAAKEVAKAELCGPAGCATVTDRDDLRLVPTGSESIAAPPPLGAFHRLTITMEGPDVHGTRPWTIWYVPAAGMIAAPGPTGEIAFHPVYGEAATFMKALAKTVRPYRAPRITRALVDGRPVSGDPATYGRLLTERSTGSTRDAGGDWVAVELASAAPSPWTNGEPMLLYSPRTRVLLRGPETIRLERSLADDLAHARALGTGGGRALFPWLVGAGLAAAVLLFAALGAVLRRRPAVPGAPEPTTA